MANKVITMQQIRTIIHLLEKGYSLRGIAAEIRLSRQTVTFYATRLKASTYSFEALRQLPDAALAASSAAAVRPDSRIFDSVFTGCS